MAGLNSLRESSQGREDLKKIITTGKDPKTGETTYTVTLPGAKKVREKLLAAGVPEKISISKNLILIQNLNSMKKLS